MKRASNRQCRTCKHHLIRAVLEDVVEIGGILAEAVGATELVPTYFVLLRRLVSHTSVDEDRSLKDGVALVACGDPTPQLSIPPPNQLKS